MGSHSCEKKKEKRRRHKQRKQAKAKRCGSASTDTSSTISTDRSQDELEDNAIELSSLQHPYGQHSEEPDDVRSVDEEFFAALDRISDDNMKYWEMSVQKEIDELEKYHDARPAFVTDEKRAVVVQVTDSSRRGSSGLIRVSTEEYFKRIHKREEKAIELCKHMRDRIEELEKALLDSKTRIMKMHRQNQRKIEKVRYFWRNKIYEGSSYGGRMLMAAVKDQDTFT